MNLSVYSEEQKTELSNQKVSSEYQRQSEEDRSVILIKAGRQMSSDLSKPRDSQD